MSKLIFRFAAPLCAAVCMLLALPSAAANDWECIGPEGASFIGSVTDPANADLVTAVTTYPSASAAYHSTDGGQSWTKLGDIPYYYLTDFAAYDLNTLYALEYYGCWYSKDGGVTWNKSTFPMGYAYAVCPHPTDPNTVYAAGYYYNAGNYDCMFYDSTDGGLTWNATIIKSGSYAIPWGMDICESNPNVMYMCGYQQVGTQYYNLTLQTTDGGTTWNDISANVDKTPTMFLYGVAIAPGDENTVYVGGTYVYRTTDGGNTWTKDTSNVFYVEGIGIDPTTTANVYVSGDENIYVSNDSGQSWTKHPCSGYGGGVEVAPAMPSTVYVASQYGGFFKSVDTGASWDAAHNGIYAAQVYSLAVAPSQPETLFLNSGSYVLMASYDCGDTMQEVVYPDGCSGTINQLLVNSQDANNVIALEAG